MTLYIYATSCFYIYFHFQTSEDVLIFFPGTIQMPPVRTEKKGLTQAPENLWPDTLA